MASEQKARNERKAPPRVQHPKTLRHPKRRGAAGSSSGRRSPWLLLAGAVLAALLLVGGLVLANQLGDDAGRAPGVFDAADTEALLAGIPQDGIALGSPDAPVTLVEYADIQCPFCAQWARDVFPTLVRDYVRRGDVRVVFHGLAFLGPESGDGLRAVLAAGEQNRLWNVLDLLMHNQGAENSGWVTDDFLLRIGRSVPGLDTERMLADRSAPAVGRLLREAERQARAAGVTGTPSFQIGATGGELRTLDVESLEPSFFAQQLDAELGR